MNDTTTGALAHCPRCGGIVGTWHTQAACDASYNRQYMAAMPPDDLIRRATARILDLEAEVERLQALRCPRCGEWVRDFPGAVSPTPTEGP